VNHARDLPERRPIPDFVSSGLFVLRSSDGRSAWVMRPSRLICFYAEQLLIMWDADHQVYVDILLSRKKKEG